MKRTRKPAATENHDRWLVSYADFITLLFAFFVVLFAANQGDKAHVRALSDSIRKALKNGGPASAQSEEKKLSNRSPNPKAETAAKAKEARDGAEASLLELSSSLQTLKSSLAAEVENGAIHLSLEQRGLVISLEAAAFFPSGSDIIESSSYGAIGKVADVLKRLPNSLRLEGHTDSQPISNSRFRNNWELSSARSIAMLQILSERFGLPPQRMAIVGYADTEGVDSNETEQGRGRNRRVDIVVVSRYGMQAEPAHATNSPKNP